MSWNQGVPHPYPKQPGTPVCRAMRPPNRLGAHHTEAMIFYPLNLEQVFSTPALCMFSTKHLEAYGMIPAERLQGEWSCTR